MTTPTANDLAIAPGSTVLVTGGTGFVGAYVIRDLLNQGYKVKAIRRNGTLPHFIEPNILEKAQWIECDIFDVVGLEEAMHHVDAVIHAAAVVSFAGNDKQRLSNVNINGTANVVNAALESKVKKLVHVSSVATLGKKKDGSMVTEENKWQENGLNTSYAVSKHMGEMHVWRGIAEGLPAVIVNPSTILGYGNWNASSSALFRNVFEGFRWYSTGATGFVDVEDVSRAIVRLLATNIHSQRFILNGENWTYRKLLDTIADAFGRQRPTWKATPLLAELAWRWEKIRSMLTGKKILLSRESARIAQTNTTFDNSKILNALPGFTFTRLEDTITRASSKYALNHPL